MIRYIKGDLFDLFKTSTSVDDDAVHVIVHVVNDVGAWGRGFVIKVEENYPEAKKHYKENWKTRQLGDVDILRVDKDVIVANVFGQHGLRSVANKRPVNYDAVIKALFTLKNSLDSQIRGDVVIHMPKIGCGLGGGNWLIMETIVSTCLSGYKVNIYEL